MCVNAEPQLNANLFAPWYLATARKSLPKVARHSATILLISSVMPRPLRAFLRLPLWSVGSLFACARAGAAEPLAYNRDIRPILSDNCFACHGPAKQKNGLRLDMREV